MRSTPRSVLVASLAVLAACTGAPDTAIDGVAATTATTAASSEPSVDGRASGESRDTDAPSADVTPGPVVESPAQSVGQPKATPSDGGQANAQNPEPAEPSPTPSIWQPAMLRAEDVPETWEQVGEPDDHESGGDASEEPNDGGGQGGGRDMKICNQASFGAGVEFAEAEDLAGAVFREALFGPYASSLAATLPAGRVEKLLTDLDEAGRSCRTWVETNENGDETIFTIEPIEADTGTDQTVAFDVTIQSGPFSFEMDLLLWRLGDVGAAIFHVGAVGTVDRSLSLEMATSVSGRMLEIATA